MLLNHFAAYLSSSDKSKCSKLKASDWASDEPVFVKRWVKVSHGIMFVLSTGLVQMFFKDKTELFVCRMSKGVTYISKDDAVTSVSLQDAQADEGEIGKRMKYCKQIIKQK